MRVGALEPRIFGATFAAAEMHSDPVRCTHMHPSVFESRKKKAQISGAFSGASRTRTGDLLGAIQALSQLSYSPERVSV
jgi:hypothetical protein